MRLITVAILLIVATACGGSPNQPQSSGSPASEPEVLGPPPTLAGTALADTGEIQPADPSKFNKTPGYSPYAGRNYPERVYFGDEHVHTAWSVDAGGTGTTLGPEEAVRFARGEEVVSTSGQPVKLGKPLDWIAVTDHSDGMGVITEIKAGNAEMMQDATIKRWHDQFASGGKDANAAVMELIKAQSTKKLPPLIMDPKFAKAVWDKNIAIQEKYNEPGRFTAFIAYEWTSNAGGGDNLHRNVIYRDGKSKAEQVLPMTTFQSENPEELWKWMAAWEQKTGGKLLAIPHNGNLSNGRMFPLTTFAGDAMTKQWAEDRQRWEPLFEALQMKGQSESHPSLSTTDEFAVNYELWDRGNLTQTPKKPGMIQDRVPARGPEEWLEGRTRPWSQSIQIRDGGWHRHPQRIGRRGRGQLLCQISVRRTERRPLERKRHELRGAYRQRLGDVRRRFHGCLGDWQYPRGAVGRDETS